MKMEISQFRPVRGHDGQGFNATLHIDGKKAAFVDDDGYGGGYNYRWFDEGLRGLFIEHVKSLPPMKNKYFPDGLKPDGDMVIGLLIEAFEAERERKRITKRCIAETLYVAPGLKTGQFYALKRPFTAEAKERVLLRQPKAEFINEHLDDGRWALMIGLKEVVNA